MGSSIECSVKVRLPGEKVWRFLRPDGGTTRLWIHGIVCDPARAAELVTEVALLNPGVEAKWTWRR